MGKILWRRNGNPLQYSRLENPIDRGAWQATVHGIARVRHDFATKPPPRCAESKMVGDVPRFSRRTGKAPVLQQKEVKVGILEVMP